MDLMNPVIGDDVTLASAMDILGQPVFSEDVPVGSQPVLRFGSGDSLLDTEDAAGVFGGDDGPGDWLEMGGLGDILAASTIVDAAPVPAHELVRVGGDDVPSAAVAVDAATFGGGDICACGDGSAQVLPLRSGAEITVEVATLAVLASPVCDGAVSRISPPLAAVAAPTKRRRSAAAAKGTKSKSRPKRTVYADAVFGVTTGDTPRNGLGAILDFMRASAIARAEWNEGTGVFEDPAQVWREASASVDTLTRYFSGIFTHLKFRKHTSKSVGLSVDKYVPCFLARQQFIKWDLDRQTASFNPEFMELLWKSSLEARAADTSAAVSKTHTSNFKAAFYNAVKGVPVPHAIVKWAREVVDGTAWLHSSHLRTYEERFGGVVTKLRPRTKDEYSITGRAIVIVPRNIHPASTPATAARVRTLAPGAEQGPAKRARLPFMDM